MYDSHQSQLLHPASKLVFVLALIVKNFFLGRFIFIQIKSFNCVIGEYLKNIYLLFSHCNKNDNFQINISQNVLIILSRFTSNMSMMTTCALVCPQDLFFSCKTVYCLHRYHFCTCQHSVKLPDCILVFVRALYQNQAQCQLLACPICQYYFQLQLVILFLKIISS